MSWKKTRDGYMQRIKLARRNSESTVLVMTNDLQYMLEELEELDLVRGQLGPVKEARRS